MSKIDTVVISPSKLVDILADYQDELDQVKTRISISGKNLERANSEQAGWYVHYDERKAELKTLVKYYNGQVDRVRGSLSRRYVENYSKVLSDRMTDKYIDSDSEFLSINALLLEVEEMYEKYVAVVEAFKSRGFALRNITEIRVHQIQDAVI